MGTGGRRRTRGGDQFSVLHERVGNYLFYMIQNFPHRHPRHSLEGIHPY